MKMKKIELMGCLSRIRNCAVDILTIEDVVSEEEGEEEEEDEEELRDLIVRQLQLKTTFLYFDLNRVISNSKDGHKEALTELANKFFHCIQEVTLIDLLCFFISVLICLSLIWSYCIADFIS